MVCHSDGRQGYVGKMSKDPGYSDSRKDTLESSNRSLRAELEKLQAENAKLRECIERYSRIRDYDISGDARQVLKELGDV